MDTYAPRLHALGLKASIGKGKRNEAVKEAMKTHKAVYLGATGGAGALLSQCVKDAKVIAYEDLGPRGHPGAHRGELPAPGHQRRLWRRTLHRAPAGPGRIRIAN